MIYNKRMTLTTWFETQIADEATQGVSIENRSFYLRQDKPAFTAVLIVHGFSANPNDGRTVADRILGRAIAMFWVFVCQDMARILKPWRGVNIRIG